MNIIAKQITINTKPERKKNAKPVYCISDGKVYPSATDAAIENGVTYSSISSVCIGRLKTANNKKFCYVADISEHLLEIASTVQVIKSSADKYAAIERKQKQEEQIAKYMRQAEHHKLMAEKALEKAESLRKLN